MMRLTEGLQMWLQTARAQLPVPCIVCDRPVPTRDNLCPACRDELPWIERACSRCGNCRVGLPLADGRCGACRLKPPPFARCQGLLHYTSPVDSLVTGFKFNARFDMGLALAALLANRMQQHYAIRSRPQLLIPVPLSRNRLRQRGYNQALEIGRVVAKAVRMPVCDSVVARTRDTPPQTGLSSARSRRHNVRQAFRVRKPARLAGVQRLALVDDVVTTMATVSALSLELRRCGVEHIDVWCLARAAR